MKEPIEVNVTGGVSTQKITIENSKMNGLSRKRVAQEQLFYVMGGILMFIASFFFFRKRKNSSLQKVDTIGSGI